MRTLEGGGVTLSATAVLAGTGREGGAVRRGGGGGRRVELGGGSVGFCDAGGNVAEGGGNGREEGGADREGGGGGAGGRALAGGEIIDAGGTNAGSGFDVDAVGGIVGGFVKVGDEMGRVGDGGGTVFGRGGALGGADGGCRSDSGGRVGRGTDGGAAEASELDTDDGARAVMKPPSSPRVRTQRLGCNKQARTRSRWIAATTTIWESGDTQGDEPLIHQRIDGRSRVAVTVPCHRSGPQPSQPNDGWMRRWLHFRRRPAKYASVRSVPIV